MQEDPAPLAACPFCGYFGASLQHAWQTHFVHCPECGAYGPACSGQPANHAVERWNQRNGRLPRSPDPDLTAGAIHIGDLSRLCDFFD